MGGTSSKGAPSENIEIFHIKSSISKFSAAVNSELDLYKTKLYNEANTKSLSKTEGVDRSNSTHRVKWELNKCLTLLINLLIFNEKLSQNGMKMKDNKEKKDFIKQMILDYKLDIIMADLSDISNEIGTLDEREDEEANTKTYYNNSDGVVKLQKEADIYKPEFKEELQKLMEEYPGKKEYILTKVRRSLWSLDDKSLWDLKKLSSTNVTDLQSPQLRL